MVKITSGSSILVRQNNGSTDNFDVRFLQICLVFLIFLFKDNFLIQILSTYCQLTLVIRISWIFIMDHQFILNERL